jgi:acetyl-CoA acetyltransferase
MTQFGKHVDRTARDLVEEAVAAALRAADLTAPDVHAAYVANAVDGLISGQECMRAQTVLRRTGLMGVPIVNVENADASGSTALHLAWQAVAYGIHDCVVAVGYEKLDHVDRSRSYRAVNSGMDLADLSDFFGLEAGGERSELLRFLGLYYGPDGSPLSRSEILAMVSVKNHHHASLNPCAHHRRPVTVEQVLASRPISGPLTRLMCAPLSDGAACVVLCADAFRRGRRGGVRIAASVLRSGRGDDMTRPMTLHAAFGQAYEMAGVGPEDLDLAEVHDVTAISELVTCSELGLCPPDEVARLLVDRTTWLGGRVPVNTSGGLLARGHPLGATGIAQVVELTMQLEGRCGPRQVPSARVGLADNVGGWVGSDAGAGGTHVLTR